MYHNSVSIVWNYFISCYTYIGDIKMESEEK